VRSPFTERPTIYLYESVPGGVGMAEQLFTMHTELLKAARDLAAGCACVAGCPSCVGPHNEVGGNPKQAAITMLDSLLARGAIAVSDHEVIGGRTRPRRFVTTVQLARPAWEEPDE